MNENSSIDDPIYTANASDNQSQEIIYTLTDYQNEFIVNTYKGDEDFFYNNYSLFNNNSINDSLDQVNPKVTTLNDGSFVVVWESPLQEYQQSEILNNPNILKVGTQVQHKGLYGQKFSHDGSKIGEEFSVNSIRDGNQSNHDIVALSHGGFVVVWENGIEKTSQQ